LDWASLTIIQVEARRLGCHHEKVLDGSAKYELLQRVAGVKIVVFRGRETRTGQSVLLHQLTEPNDHTVVLKRAVEYLLKNPASAGGRILDLVDIQGGNFLVTLDQPECLALREWLDWELDGPKPAASPAPSPLPAVPPAAATREPGEFTRLFQKPPSAVTAQARPPAPATAGPGEFTQLFARSAPSQRPDPPQPVAQVEPPSMPIAPTPMPVAPAPMPNFPAPAASENQPGEFTRLFRSPLAPPSEGSRDPMPVASPAQNSAGEFTRIFGGGTPRGSGQPVAPPSPPGSLTESLEPRQSAPPMIPPASAGPGEFTRVINRPSSVPPTPSPLVASSPPPPPAAAPPSFAMPTVPSAPSSPQMPHAPQVPQAPQMPQMAAPAPATSRTPIALIILFAVLILAAFGLILFVILRR
jgi:hypothetical protein